MQSRPDFRQVSPDGFKAMLGLESHLAHCDLDPKLLELVKVRVSQINGCAYCIDMHWRAARQHGELESRLYALDAWRESPGYSDVERAALAWAEAVTQIEHDHVPDAVYEAACTYLDDRELVDLTLAIAAINAWNRLCIAFRSRPDVHPSDTATPLAPTPSEL